MVEQLDEDTKQKVSGIIESQAWKEGRDPFNTENNDYDFNESFSPWRTGDDPRSIHTVPDLIRCLSEKDPSHPVDISAKVFYAKEGEAYLKKLNKKQFLEAAKSNSRRRVFRESIDSFLFDSTGTGEIVGGQDFVPLLGGPFTKQLYYTDYLKQHQAAFYAYHHDPAGRRIINMMKHFTLGRGFSVDCDDERGMVIWDAFVKANKFYDLFNPLSIELGIYGEIMLHWLPNHAAKVRWNVPQKDIPRAFIPRVRLTDPSTIWDIICYPEDISSVIAYQQIFPTQWQSFTAKDPATDTMVPGTKFIYQQIPASDMQHHKINCVSNEKRGRSDLFPVLSYLKRLRDAVNYGLVSEMKNAAWCIDTTVDGSPTDVQNYIASQRALGTIPSAGSEFVHTKKIERKYAANQGAGAKDSMIFEWCMSMIAMGSGIPISFFGGSQAGHQTRASAVVGTEPVTKMFEDRQNEYEKIVKEVSARLFAWAGLPTKTELKISFPELITQDRSAKLKDIALARSEGWINARRAAEMAAKELGIDDFDFDTEGGEVDADASSLAGIGAGSAPLSSNGGMSGGERRQIKNNDRK